jgi:hypothetical protein
MHGLSLAAGTAAAISGIVSAYYWWSSTKVQFGRFEPETWEGLAGHERPARLRPLFDYVDQTGKANKKAAIASGITAVLGGLSAFLGSIGL